LKLSSLGEDCAVIRINADELLLVSTDTVLEKTHIPREMEPEQIGIYSVNVVLSDIAAMGGSPIGMVFSIALPPNLDKVFLKKLAEGMQKAAIENKTCIVGGDTQEASQITITGTAFGRVKEKGLLLRSGANLGDLICVSGLIGSAAGGFYSLVKGLEGFDRLIKHAFEPRARLKEGQIISACASSCIDISDGLALSIHDLTKQSGVGFRIFFDKIPFDPLIVEVSKLTGVSKSDIILYKGGDFELLFTMTPDKFHSLKEKFEKEGSSLTVIGEIIKKGNILIDENEVELKLERKGWRAFKKDIFFKL
jgi:thiamine-monophosphate kinase